MAAGGEWRNDALWIPTATNGDNYYKLENLAKRGRFLTWTYRMHNKFNYYIQLANYDAKEDAMFSFKTNAVKLVAKVYDFKFEESMGEILKRAQDVSESLLSKKRIPNASGTEITATVEDSSNITGPVTFNFKESFAMMLKTTIDTGDKVFTFDGGFKANQDRSMETTTFLSFNEKIQIAPYTIIDATLSTTTASNIEIPFTAKMLVIGSTERMLKDRPGETREGTVPAELVRDYVMSSGSSKIDVVSRTGDSLIVRVSGVFKATVALKISMNTTKIDIFTVTPSNTTEVGIFTETPSTMSPIYWD